MRRVIARIGVVVAAGWLVLVLFRLSDPLTVPPDDFLAFWSATRLFVAGSDPYDPEALLAVQRLANWTKDHPYRLWEPPWTLMLFGAFATLPYHEARFAWFVVSLVLLVACTDRLWIHYGGPRAHRGASWIIVITFVPAILVWKTGQVTVFVLAGLVCLLVLARRGRMALATATFVLLASTKPHVAYLVWVALAVHILRGGRWRAAASAVAAVGVVLLAPLPFRPSALQDYATTVMHHPPQYLAPTLATLLRGPTAWLTGSDAYPLVFVPALVAAAWVTARIAGARDVRWDGVVPVLLPWSLLTAPVAWIYDAALLIVPAVRIFSRVLPQPDLPGRRRILWAYALLQVVVLAANLTDVDPFMYFWVPFALLLWYLDADRLLRRSGEAEHGVSGYSGRNP